MDYKLSPYFSAIAVGVLTVSGCSFDESGLRHLENANLNNLSNVNSNNSNSNASCGDGLVGGGEACDDGNISPNDGCGPDCSVENGYQCAGEPSVCTATCGDGLVATGTEGCDDGNATPGDGCGLDCQVELGYVCFGEPSVCNETCGNGSLDTGEACDDGNNNSCDGCAADCSREDNLCGDGFSECGEVCDDGNNNSCDGCSADCTRVDSQCGDGIAECGEVCDDGNNDDCDGCRGDCSAQETGCGDGFLCGPEVCDDGNNDDCDGCTADCTRVDNQCGDGVRECAEACDGNDFGGATCSSETGGTQPGGTLACTASCTIDTSGCLGSVSCPNNASCPTGQQCIDSSCQPVGDTCDDSPVVLSSSGIFSHTLENLTNSYNAGSSGLACPELGIADTNGRDRVYRIDLAAGDYFSAWVHPQGWNPVLFVTDTCPVTSCLRGRNDASINQDQAPERLDYVATTAQTIYLVVDGDDDDGDYTLDFVRGSASDWTQLDDSMEVLFSEILPDPQSSDFGVNDACEWFELFNADTSLAVNLGGATFVTDAGSFSIHLPLLIGPQEHMLIARTAEYGFNCGLGPVSWSYKLASFNLYYVSDCLLELYDSGDNLVDDVAYDSGWPFQDGRSMYLCNNHLSRADNDDSSNWRVTTNSSQYTYTGSGYSNQGTPAEANPGTCN